jgi:hypothetical protein
MILKLKNILKVLDNLLENLLLQLVTSTLIIKIIINSFKFFIPNQLAPCIIFPILILHIKLIII